MRNGYFLLLLFINLFAKIRIYKKKINTLKIVVNSSKLNPLEFVAKVGTIYP